MVEEYDGDSRRHQVAQRTIDNDNFDELPVDILRVARGVVTDLRRV